MTGIPAPIERFVLHWGEMGGFWGVNRSVGQIHAFLYVAERPLTAEEISAELGMARSNVSTSLKELQSWGLVRRVPIKGERKEHFEAETDVWEMATRIAAGRKQREIDPAVATLRLCLEEAAAYPSMSKVQIERLEKLLEFTQSLTRFYEQMNAVARPQLMALIRLGAKIVTLLPDFKTKKA